MAITETHVVVSEYEADTVTVGSQHYLFAAPIPSSFLTYADWIVEFTTGPAIGRRFTVATSTGSSVLRIEFGAAPVPPHPTNGDEFLLLTPDNRLGQSYIQGPTTLSGTNGFYVGQTMLIIGDIAGFFGDADHYRDIASYIGDTRLFGVSPPMVRPTPPFNQIRLPANTQLMLLSDPDELVIIPTTIASTSSVVDVSTSTPAALIQGELLANLKSDASRLLRASWTNQEFVDEMTVLFASQPLLRASFEAIRSQDIGNLNSLAQGMATAIRPFMTDQQASARLLRDDWASPDELARELYELITTTESPRLDVS